MKIENILKSALILGLLAGVAGGDVNAAAAKKGSLKEGGCLDLIIDAKKLTNDLFLDYHNCDDNEPNTITLEGGKLYPAKRVKPATEFALEMSCDQGNCPKGSVNTMHIFPGGADHSGEKQAIGTGYTITCMDGAKGSTPYCIPNAVSSSKK